MLVELSRGHCIKVKIGLHFESIDCWDLLLVPFFFSHLPFLLYGSTLSNLQKFDYEVPVFSPTIQQKKINNNYVPDLPLRRCKNFFSWW